MFLTADGYLLIISYNIWRLEEKQKVGPFPSFVCIRVKANFHNKNFDLALLT